MTRSRNSYGRDGGAASLNAANITRNAKRVSGSLSPRGTTNVRTALSAVRAMM